MCDAHHLPQLFLLFLFLFGLRCAALSRPSSSSRICGAFGPFRDPRGSRCRAVWLLLLAEHFHGLSVQFLVALDHELLEGEEAVDRHYLIDYLFVDGVLFGTLARLHKLLIAHAQLRHQLLEQILNYLFEVLHSREKRKQHGLETIVCLMLIISAGGLTL